MREKGGDWEREVGRIGFCFLFFVFRFSFVYFVASFFFFFLSFFLSFGFIL